MWTKVMLNFSLSNFLGKIFGILLPCQIETETGSAGEQPVRDKFDLHDVVNRGLLVLGSPFFFLLRW